MMFKSYSSLLYGESFIAASKAREIVLNHHDFLDSDYDCLQGACVETVSRFGERKKTSVAVKWTLFTKKIWRLLK